MARAQLKIDHDLSVPDQAPPLGRALPAAPSSARAMQERLMAQTAAVPRWPVGQRVALIVSASLALWTAVLHATAQVAHAVA